jgi:hypothetical protein
MAWFRELTAKHRMVAILQDQRIFLVPKEAYRAGETYALSQYTSFPDTPEGIEQALLWLSEDYSEFNADWESE